MNKEEEKSIKEDSLEVFLHTDLCMRVLRRREEALIAELDFLVGDDLKNEREKVLIKLQEISDTIIEIVAKFTISIGV